MPVPSSDDRDDYLHYLTGRKLKVVWWSRRTGVQQQTRGENKLERLTSTEQSWMSWMRWCLLCFFRFFGNAPGTSRCSSWLFSVVFHIRSLGDPTDDWSICWRSELAIWGWFIRRISFVDVYYMIIHMMVSQHGSTPKSSIWVGISFIIYPFWAWTWMSQM